MDPVEILMHWLAKNYSKLILLAVVLIVAALIDKALTKVVRRVLDKSQVPNASIFVNIMRAVVWVFAIGTLLQPVFGINPTTIFTALGIGGLAVSLGLKDTIANVIGGFGLMLGDNLAEFFVEDVEAVGHGHVWFGEDNAGVDETELARFGNDYAEAGGGSAGVDAKNLHTSMVSDMGHTGTRTG